MTISHSSLHHPPLGLYIHWPFCLSKCPYCDFNSFVGKNINHDDYYKAYMLELERMHTLTPHHTLQTLFFGGGTPSLMPPTLTEAIIQKAMNLWSVKASHLEITLEANPSTAEINRFNDFKNAGINRLSIGIQSFDDKELAFLGRGHSAKEGIHAIELAQKIFDRVSFDLIYARPHQRLDDWEKELQFALSFDTSHLSLYQLTIEPGTAFAPRYERGDIILPEEDLAADLYSLTQKITESAALPSYEVSNHAKIGQESQHNLIYWRYHDYVGVGPGAHGRYRTHNSDIALTSCDNKHATEQHRAPDIWLQKVLNEGSGNSRVSHISTDEQIRERLMMGLRLKEGVELDDATLLTHLTESRIQSLIDHAYLIKEKNRIKLTQQGMIRLNSILRYILAK